PVHRCLPLRRRGERRRLPRWRHAEVAHGWARDRVPLRARCRRGARASQCGGVVGREGAFRVRRRAPRLRDRRAALRVRDACRRGDLRGARGPRDPRRGRPRHSSRTAQALVTAPGRRSIGSGLDHSMPARCRRAHADRYARTSRPCLGGDYPALGGAHLRLPPRSDTSVASLFQYARGDGPRARAARTAPRRARCRLTRPLHRGRILAWIALIAFLAVPSYALRLDGKLVGLQPDDFFKYSTAIAAISVDAVLLLIVLVIARGLPLRETFALRAPS